MWKGFQKPKRLASELESLTERYGRFSAQPFERGWGTTVGNGLRRALLSSIEGAAITAVKIEGVLHEFSSIPGVVEDATDIILNLLQVQDDVGGVFHHSRNRREFVQHALDLHRGDRRAFDRAQQRSPQPVSDRGTPAPFKRLRRKPAVPLRQRFQLRRKTLRFLKSLPHPVPSFRDRRRRPLKPLPFPRLRVLQAL